MKFGDGDLVAFRLAPPAGQFVSIALEYLKIYEVDCHEIG